MRRATLLLMLFTIAACDNGSGYTAVHAAGYRVEAAQHPNEAKPRKFTKSEFSNYVYGKTKAQLRAEFGAPFAVDDTSDEWKYGTNIGVVDAEAGTPVYVAIRFTGFDGPDDEATSARYF